MIPPAPTRIRVVPAARWPITTAVAALATPGMPWCSATQRRRYPQRSTCCARSSDRWSAWAGSPPSMTGARSRTEYGTMSGLDAVGWRAMRRWTLVFWLFTAAASAADDPPGTQAVDLGVGKTHRIEAPPGSNVLCDDPAVAVGEFTDDGNAYQLRGVKPGITLCGVWLGNMK